MKFEEKEMVIIGTINLKALWGRFSSIKELIIVSVGLTVSICVYIRVCMCVCLLVVWLSVSKLSFYRQSAFVQPAMARGWVIK